MVRLFLSGDDIGNQHIFEHCDFVLESQLALFDPCDLHLIDDIGDKERIDRDIQIAMFLAKELDSSCNHFAVQPGVSLTVADPCSDPRASCSKGESGCDSPRATPGR